MKKRLTLVLSCLILFVAESSFAQQPDVRSWTSTFLDAYARADGHTVLRSVDESTTIYGSDVAEVFHGRAGVTSMLQNDAKLWGGKAHIGEMQNVSVAGNERFQTIFFNAPFTLGDRPPVPIRFSMVWKKSKGGWILVQSSNAVVTEGQSAQELVTGKPQ